MHQEPEKLSRSEQARVNGAKSKGPTSIEGKAKSSQNGLKHGFAATPNVVLQIEDPALFAVHLAGIRAALQPRNYLEQTLVEQLASISWRQSRLVAIESHLLNAQMTLLQENVASAYPDHVSNPYFCLVLGWQAIAHKPQPVDPKEPHQPTQAPEGYDITSIELVRRYQVSLDRQYRNTLLNLRQIQSMPEPAPVVERAPEPEAKQEPQTQAAAPTEPNKSPQPPISINTGRPQTFQPRTPPEKEPQ